MTEADHQSTKKLHRSRVLIIYVLVGVVLSCLLGMLRLVTGLPESASAGIVAGVLVGLGPVLNWLVRKGKASWLLKE